MANDDPRAPYKVYEGDECQRHPIRHALKRAAHNSGSRRPNRNRTSSSGTFWAMSFHDWLVERTPQIRPGRLVRLLLQFPC